MEIYFSGTWGTITDSDWTSHDAQAVCRKLGYFKPGIIVSYKVNLHLQQRIRRFKYAFHECISLVLSFLKHFPAMITIIMYSPLL